MTVRRFTSVPALGAMVFVALGLLVSTATAHRISAPTVSIVSVRAFSGAAEGPRSILLTPRKPCVTQNSKRCVNVVTTTSNLAFKVNVRNQAGRQESNITITFTLDRSVMGLLVRQATVAVINPGQTKTVSFNHVQPVPFASPTTLTVKVASGPAKVYPVIFSLPA